MSEHGERLARAIARDTGITRRRLKTSDPAAVYENVSVALDAGRQLYNGAPGIVAAWLDALDPQPGERVFHAGCGTGYFSAVAATLAGARERMNPRNGRLVIPLAVPLPGQPRLSRAFVFLITRAGGAYAAAMIGGAIIFSAAEAAPRRLIDRFDRGDPHEVRSLRRDAHTPDASCWLHEERDCLSRD